MSVFARHELTGCGDIAFPTLAVPLPRLSFEPDLHNSRTQCYEVITIGAGPAGLMLNLLLARLGLSDRSRLGIEARSLSTQVGNADGLTQRTLEVLKSLDLVDEIINHGKHNYEFSRWHVVPEEPEKGIQRQFWMRLPMGKSRFKQGMVAIGQGRLQRILKEDLMRYSKTGITENVLLISVKIADDEPSDYPVEAVIEQDGQRKVVRSKYLVGADGAHSIVRRSLGIEMDGSMIDDIWGVMDLVVDSNFPDIRRDAHILAADRIVSIIPRERLNSGDHLTRIYVPFMTVAQTLKTSDQDRLVAGLESRTDEKNESEAEQRARLEKQQRAAKASVSLESILARLSALVHPYYIRPKQGVDVPWWAAYQVGQRVARDLVTKDKHGTARIFLIGDACHTHSPAVGQGLNISILDALDLAWKLMYTINGLTPNPQALFDTFEQDRRRVAQDLIDSDRLWYRSRYRIRSQDGTTNGRKDKEEEQISKENFMVSAEMVAFLSGTGIEYEEGYLVDPKIQNVGGVEDGKSQPLLISTDYDANVLREGRRLGDAIVERFVDGRYVNLQDDFPCDGKMRILTFTTADLLEGKARQHYLPQQNGAANGIDRSHPPIKESGGARNGTGATFTASASRSVKTVTTLCQDVLPQFPAGTLELVFLTPLEPHSFEWTDVPGCLCEVAEHGFHLASEATYAEYGVDVARGAIVVVRPDGHVGSVAALSDVGKVRKYLERCLVKKNAHA